MKNDMVVCLLMSDPSIDRSVQRAVYVGGLLSTTALRQRSGALAVGCTTAMAGGWRAVVASRAVGDDDQ